MQGRIFYKICGCSSEKSLSFLLSLLNCFWSFLSGRVFYFAVKYSPLLILQSILEYPIYPGIGQSDQCLREWHIGRLGGTQSPVHGSVPCFIVTYGDSKSDDKSVQRSRTCQVNWFWQGRGYGLSNPLIVLHTWKYPMLVMAPGSKHFIWKYTKLETNIHINFKVCWSQLA